MLFPSSFCWGYILPGNAITCHGGSGSSPGSLEKLFLNFTSANPSSTGGLMALPWTKTEINPFCFAKVTLWIMISQVFNSIISLIFFWGLDGQQDESSDKPLNHLLISPSVHRKTDRHQCGHLCQQHRARVVHRYGESEYYSPLSSTLTCLFVHYLTSSKLRIHLSRCIWRSPGLPQLFLLAAKGKKDRCRCFFLWASWD